MQRIGNIPAVNIGGKTFSATQIVDKSLIARRDTKVYRAGNWSQPFGKIRAGAPVGTVYAWVGPSSYTGGRMFWQFYYADGTTYYAEQTANSFDLSSLRQQGAITALEQVEQENPKEQTWQGTILKIAVIGIAAFAGVQLITNATGVRRRGRIIYV